MSKIKFYKTGVFINNEFKQESTVFFDTGDWCGNLNNTTVF